VDLVLFRFSFLTLLISRQAPCETSSGLHLGHGGITTH
jgi:hypothetical protein